MGNLNTKVKAAHLKAGCAASLFVGLPLQFIWVALFAAKARSANRYTAAGHNLVLMADTGVLRGQAGGLPFGEFVILLQLA